MSFEDAQIIKKHGLKIYVMSQSDWDMFRETVKEKYPEMYKVFKKEMNFDITPIEYSEI